MCLAVSSGLVCSGVFLHNRVDLGRLTSCNIMRSHSIQMTAPMKGISTLWRSSSSSFTNQQSSFALMKSNRSNSNVMLVDRARHATLTSASPCTIHLATTCLSKSTPSLESTRQTTMRCTVSFLVKRFASITFRE